VYISSEMFAYKEVSWLILLNIFLQSFSVYIHITDSARHEEIASVVFVILGLANPRRQWSSSVLFHHSAVATEGSWIA